MFFTARIMTQRSPASVTKLEDLLHRMTDRIRQSLELPEILEATVIEMCGFLKTDRVKIYRFHPDGSGEVVAEAIREQRLPSLLGQRFPAGDIPEVARELFLKQRQRSIVNVATREIGISPFSDDVVKSSLRNKTSKKNSFPISFRPVDPCHVEYLTAMGVQSSLVVPVLYRHQLWGLLVAHHSVPKRFGNRTLEIVQLIADQVSVAITHANLLQLTRLQGQHESVINQTVSYLHSTVEDPLKRAIWHVVNALKCAGGRLYIHPGSASSTSTSISTATDKWVLTGRQPAKLHKLGLHPLKSRHVNSRKLEQIDEWRTWLQNESSNQVMANLWAISDTHDAHMPPIIANAFAKSNIRSVLVAKLVHQNQFLGYLSLFRQSIDIETVWAGRLDDSDSRQQRPRQSFEAWQKIEKDRPQRWEPREVGLAQDLVDRFSSVIYQTQLYQTIQSLNADLEQRVAERTAELQAANRTLAREIVERERALEDLQAARDSLKRLSHQNELILNAAGEGIYGIDPKGKIVFSNPAAAKMLGHRKGSLARQFMHDLLKHSKPEGEPYSWEQSPIFKTLRHGQTHHVVGDAFERKDGSKFPVEYVSTSIRERGKIIGAVVIFQDITERQAIDAMKDEFIAVVSHELRTPLTSIRTALGLLAQNKIEIPPEKRQRMIKIASSNTHRLVRLVSDILDVERIKLGKIVLNKQRCNLADVMAQAVDEMQAMAAARHIQLVVSALDIELHIDPDKVIQTIANLLSNAIKFSPANSAIEVSAQQINPSEVTDLEKQLSETQLSQTGRLAIEAGLETSPSLLLVKVTDRGKGIPKDKLEAIFDQFKQLNTSDDDHQGGTGLGLAICRSIIQQHGGKIWAQSEVSSGRNPGSTFLFTLPMGKDP
ncbi:MAG: ATP-binding protein [Cyanobacteria bacterium J06554_11]